MKCAAAAQTLARPNQSLTNAHQALGGSFCSRWFKTTTFEGSFRAISAEFGRSRQMEIARFFQTKGNGYFLMLSREKAQETILIMQSFYYCAKMGSKIEVFLPFFEFR